MQISPAYAERMIERIIAKTDVLVDFPKAGRMVPEYHDENVREIIEGRYRIIYELIDFERIDITHVHHTARPLSVL